MLEYFAVSDFYKLAINAFPCKKKFRLQMKPSKKVRRWAICLRISIFITNAFIWVGGLASLITGLMIGLSNGTFSVDAEESDEYDGGEIRWEDFLYTTPATLLLYYGILMLITGIFGCFTATGAQICCTCMFIVMILLTIVFDAVLSWIFYWNPFSMKRFMDSLDVSMDSYGIDNGVKFGIFRQNPTKFWDHLQRTGSCCGKFSSDEWKSKTIGSEQYAASIPDSCCTREYDARNCGWRIWKHNEGDMNHYRSQMLKKIGCLSIFPKELVTEYSDISFMPIITGVLMVFGGIFATVLFCLILTKDYKAVLGPQVRPHFARKGPTTIHLETALEQPIAEDETKIGNDQIEIIQRVSRVSDNMIRRRRSLEFAHESETPRVTFRNERKIYPIEEEKAKVIEERTIQPDERKTQPEERKTQLDERKIQHAQQTGRAVIDRPKPTVSSDDSIQPLYKNRQFGSVSDIEPMPDLPPADAYRELLQTRKIRRRFDEEDDPPPKGRGLERYST